MKRLAAVIAAAGLLVAACTSSGSPAPTTSTEFQTITNTIPAPSPSIPTPITAGPTTAAEEASCPLIDEQPAAAMIGMRLDRVTVLKSGGKVVGCRFYGLQHPTAQCPEVSCLAKEKLPPGNQPVIEILSARYSSSDGARAAFIALAQKGTNVQPVTITSGNQGVCYQTTFWAKDHGQDWACTYSVGSTVVVVKTVVKSPSFNVIQVAKAIAPKFASS